MLAPAFGTAGLAAQSAPRDPDSRPRSASSRAERAEPEGRNGKDAQRPRTQRHHHPSRIRNRRDASPVPQTLPQWRECDSLIYCRINLANALIAAARLFRLRFARTPKQSRPAIALPSGRCHFINQIAMRAPEYCLRTPGSATRCTTCSLGPCRPGSRPASSWRCLLAGGFAGAAPAGKIRHVTGALNHMSQGLCMFDKSAASRLQSAISGHVQAVAAGREAGLHAARADRTPQGDRAVHRRHRKPIASKSSTASPPERPRNGRRCRRRPHRACHQRADARRRLGDHA